MILDFCVLEFKYYRCFTALFAVHSLQKIFHNAILKLFYTLTTIIYCKKKQLVFIQLLITQKQKENIKRKNILKGHKMS